MSHAALHPDQLGAAAGAWLSHPFATIERRRPPSLRPDGDSPTRKGTLVNLGNVIRVLEVPATEPAETIPAHAPASLPEHAPSVPAREPVAPARQSSADLVLVPVRRPRSESCER